MAQFQVQQWNQVSAAQQALAREGVQSMLERIRGAAAFEMTVRAKECLRIASDLRAPDPSQRRV